MTEHRSLCTTQLEKLLQKNYFLHQSARDGYRSYLQAYASHSLKKIFDVNSLDLVKVGRAFGFSVPPRVNVTVGGGKSNNSSSQKRKRSGANDDEDEEGWEDEDEAENAEEETGVVQGRRQRKARRMETLGKKMVQKEMYKKSRQRQDGQQWSR